MEATVVKPNAYRVHTITLSTELAILTAQAATTTTFTLNHAISANHLASNVLDSQLYALDVHHQPLILNIFIILLAILNAQMVLLSVDSTVLFVTLQHFVKHVILTVLIVLLAWEENTFKIQ